MGTALTSLKKIKPKYIGIWLKDQLSQPDWFRNLIVNRSQRISRHGRHCLNENAQ